MKQNGGDYVTRAAQALGWNHVGMSINLQSYIQQKYASPLENAANHRLSNYMKNSGFAFDTVLGEVINTLLRGQVAD